MFEKYYNKKNEVAVIYSPGYGAGFSTWAEGKDRIAMMFDKDIVECLIDGDNAKALGIAKEKYPDSYISDQKLSIEFIPRGWAFSIEEHDGSESIYIIGEPDYIIA